MISEEQQEQAALYALGLLDADEATSVERQMDGDAELRAFVYDCHEASASLALSAEAELGGPPPELKSRVLAALPEAAGPIEIVQPVSAVRAAEAAEPAGVSPGKIIPFFVSAIPWAIAALLMISCVLLIIRQGRLQDQNEALNASLDQSRNVVASVVAKPLLSNVAFCPLGPTSPAAPAQPLAVVAWDAGRQEGVVRIVQLTPPGQDKDYQLWAVEDGHKEPVSAGLVRLAADGSATTAFKPVAAEGSGRVVAFALSLEKAGGSPTNAGPILLLGKL